MDIKTLVKVTSRAWSLDILALMHAGIPGRQAPLLSSTGATRTAFRQSLEHLVDLGMLERNPGHGHPLRPEYRLTPRGVEIAKMADNIAGAVAGASELSLLRRAWTVPVLAVTSTPKRFTEIRNCLCCITDRALSNSLDRLQEREWLRREVNISDHPPRPIYQAVNIGLDISRAVTGGR